MSPRNKSHIRKLIESGESQTLDFKFEISDSKKIARSMVAFANTDGGRLLIGVKDNGNISGIQSDEELYMTEAAARMYCKPEMPFSVNLWNEEGKTVMETTIPKAMDKLFRALDERGLWKVYIRNGDQNCLVNGIWIQAWKKKQAGNGALIRFTDAEKILLRHLAENTGITLTEFRKKAGVDKRRAESILINMAVMGFIYIDFSSHLPVYRPAHPYDCDNPGESIQTSITDSK